MKTITNSVVRTIALCIRYQRSVIVASIVLAILSGGYAASHFSLTTDINQLISSNSPARQRELAFEKAFPQFDTIIAVVSAPTPELVQEAAGALAERLTDEKALYRSVVQPQGGSFFAQSGLLFLPTDKLEQQMKMLTQAQRLIGTMAADPSLRGVIRSLQFALLGVQSDKLTL
ncbi:MAG TPA: hopanoid biosynthesis-associated RND transporter HpnN, partial [Xanthobacteraceae bacterium]|nr:hopanoid biosynthesis-associated RND transporter HpnN [Xanthobacteraceae bacterium]